MNERLAIGITFSKVLKCSYDESWNFAEEFVGTWCGRAILYASWTQHCLQLKKNLTSVSFWFFIILFIYGKSVAISNSPGDGPTLMVTEIVITKNIKNEVWKWVGKQLGKGTGWDSAGELTSDLWQGKVEGV